MENKQSIKTFKINGHDEYFVSAKELHNKLSKLIFFGSFEEWIKNVLDYEFKENIDYIKQGSDYAFTNNMVRDVIKLQNDNLGAEKGYVLESITDEYGVGSVEVYQRLFLIESILKKVDGKITVFELEDIILSYKRNKKEKEYYKNLKEGDVVIVHSGSYYFTKTISCIKPNFITIDETDFSKKTGYSDWTSKIKIVNKNSNKEYGAFLDYQREHNKQEVYVQVDGRSLSEEEKRKLFDFLMTKNESEKDKEYVEKLVFEKKLPVSIVF